MATIGEKFRTVRQSSGWTVDDVSRRIKLPAAIIEAIESNEFYKLPSPTYAIGFIRNYSKLLGLNDKEMVNEFIQQNKEASPTSLDLRDEIIAHDQDRKGSRIFWIFLVIIMIGLGSYFLIRYYRVSRKSVARQKEVVDEKKRDKLPEVSLVGRYQRMMMDKKGPSHVPSTRVSITVIKEVFISVSEGENLLFSGVLKEGASEEWASDEAIIIKVGSPDAVRLFVNEQDKGIVGENMSSPNVLSINGESVHVSLPEHTPDE